MVEIAEREAELPLDEEVQVENLSELPDDEGDDGKDFGTPGRRFDRRSPFWIGLTGALGVGAAFLLAWAVVSAREVLLLIVLSLFIAVGLEPVVAALYRRRVPRGLAVAAVS